MMGERRPDPEERHETGKGTVPRYRHKQTELINGEKAREYIGWQLERMQAGERCAVFMISLDNTAEVNAVLGCQEEAYAERLACQTLSAFFKASDVVSRIGRDEYLVFEKGSFTKEEVTAQAKGLCESLRYEMGAETVVPVTASVGVYMTEDTGGVFEKIFGQAAAALYEAKNNGRQSFCVMADPEKEEAEKQEWREKPEGAISLQTLIEYMDGGVALIEAGPQIRLLYASTGFFRILGGGEGELAIPCSLEQIGIHPDYAADYEQILRKSVDKEGISDHIQRISRKRTDWIWRHVRVARVAYPGSRYPVLLELSTDISELIRKDRQLRESNERLRVAFHQTPHRMWEVDIDERTYNTFNIDEECCSPDTAVGNFPWAFVEQGIIHPDSAADFCSFADKLLEGKAAGTGNFIMKDQASGCYGWTSLSYRMTFDREGRPLKAVGVQSKLPDLSGIGSTVFPRRALPEVMRHHVFVRVKANITGDYVEEIWIDGVDQTAWSWGKTYSEIIDIERARLFLENEGNGFAERFSREKLLEAYSEGNLWSTVEYRRIDSAGNIRWMKDLVNLVREPKSGDIYMFVCFCDSQQRHDWERAAGYDILRDEKSGVYTAGAVKMLAERLIGNGGSEECALSMIRVVGGPWSRSGEAGEKENRSWRFLATVMSTALGMDCIVGQYHPDTLLAFFPKAGSRFELKRRIEDAFAYIRICMNDIYGIERSRFVAGTVTEPLEEADYEVLLMRTGYLCQLWKNSAMDTVAFPSEDEDWAWAGMRKVSGGTLVREQEMDRALTKEEQNAAFHCVTDMLAARSLESSLLNALRCLGQYYQAVRTYILSLTDEQRTVTMLYEWTNRGRQSIQHVLAGVQIDGIPLLKKCMEQRQPVFMESPAVTDCGPAEKWRFTVFPLEKEDEIRGFLCIENAQEHYRDAALIGTLLPYITGEQKRFERLTVQAQTTGHDALTNLPNLSAYMDVIYSLDSDSYSSMGALALDVPNFSVINSSFGFEYGRKFLLFLAETLENVFGRSYIFRTWDAEFVVLFPNTIREVFNGRCERLRAMIQRRYPRQVRIGSVWSDGMFSARNLVREAQAVMRSESVKEAGEESTALAEEKEWTAEKKITASNFIPYFQPKIDMRSGRLIGAEALARGIDRAGNLVTPGNFIERLEADGLIRELDLLMLDGVLRQLSEWKQKGFPLLKVSINISRITLFNPTSLASVLAIQSRYPDIPAEQIELEITETAGDMAKGELSRIVDDFRECGICFELDDFGSGYANISLFSNIRFNTIKLDRSIINDLPGNEISCVFVKNIAQICENFGMQCVAEGVETQQQEQALLKAGCYYGQGYYYARPLPAREFEKRYLMQEING